jgi:hypothetical protein
MDRYQRKNSMPIGPVTHLLLHKSLKQRTVDQKWQHDQDLTTATALH